MQEEINKRFKKFVEKYWTLTSLKSINQPTNEDLYCLKRGIWYCNYTGEIIPQLQKFNAINNNDAIINDDPDDTDNDEVSSISKLFYDQGYNTYHVYPCGHCFIDIYPLSGLFDYIHSYMQNLLKKEPDVIDEYVKQKLTRYFTQCLCCGLEQKNNRLQMYTLNTLIHSLDISIVISRDCVIPKKWLGAVSQEIIEGDVIDTSGVRGMGLYIYEGNLTYSKVPTGRCCPIWPLKYLKLRGYLYYLTKTPEPWFDALHFENGIDGIYDGDSILFVSDQSYEFDKNNFPLNIETINEKSTKISHENRHITVTKRDDNYFEMTYPFIDETYANMLLYSGLNLKAQLTSHEYIIFRDTVMYISTLDGSIEHNVSDIYYKI